MSYEMISPVDRKELLETLSQYKDRNYRLGAGFTDLLIELKNGESDGLTVINMGKVNDKQLNGIVKVKEHIEIGSLTTVANVIRNPVVRKSYPVLHEAASGLASQQIREVATVGGNLGQASPSGDVSCALVALQAQLSLLNYDGKTREVAIEDFFTGPGETILQPGEIVEKIKIPVNKSNRIHSGYIKIGKRSAMECSIFSLAYHFQTGTKNTVVKSGVAMGAVAPVIIFAKEASGYLLEKNLSEMTEKDKKQFALLLQKASSPIDDMRASAWYRKEVLYSSAISIFE